MTRDDLLAAATILSFAVLVTVHVVIVVALAARSPRWHALAALAMPPLAPYWAARRGRPSRAILWAVSAVAYGMLRAFATGGAR